MIIEKSIRIKELRDWLKLPAMGKIVSCPFSEPAPCKECLNAFPRGKRSWVQCPCKNYLPEEVFKKAGQILINEEHKKGGK